MALTHDKYDPDKLPSINGLRLPGLSPLVHFHTPKQLATIQRRCDLVGVLPLRSIPPELHSRTAMYPPADPRPHPPGADPTITHPTSQNSGMVGFDMVD